MKARETYGNQGFLEGILDEAEFGVPCADLSAAALRVLEARYLLRNAKGEVFETAQQMFARVARAVAEAEAKWWKSEKGGGSREDYVRGHARRFYELMATLRFLPNSPTLMNAGRPKGQLSACFVLPIEDDLGRVFDTLRDSAVIHKSGGGTGFNFGLLRHSGDVISSSGGRASGPVAFLKIFDVATQTVKQGGTRRGANMAILPVDHPDIGEFITSKLDGDIANFNLSVGVSKAFMDAVRKNKRWDLCHPRTREVVRSVRARSIWRLIAECAWKSGDPGVVFLDRIESANPTPELGRLDSTNPCGEQPLLPYESCNLGSINLVAYICGETLQWNELERDIHTAVRFLDDIIDVNSYPLLAIEDITMMNRKIGLGVMGWADVLMEWGIAYDSDEALERGEAVMRRIGDIAVRASEALAVERGAFPAFSKSIWSRHGHAPRRNATVTTVAPTGTISIIAGVSSGIEPVYSLAYERDALDGDRMVFLHPVLRRVLRHYNVRSRKVLGGIIETGSVQQCEEIPRKVRRSLKTAMEIKPTWHIRMQAAFQRHTENGVSKTINLPASATVLDIQRIFESAYELGCKGITVFRDTSKSTQVLRRGVSARKEGKRNILEAVEWLLDDGTDQTTARKKASVGLASLSRAHLKQQRR